MRIGLDIGSTTIKAAVLNETNDLVFKVYERHFSQVRPKALELIKRIKAEFPGMENAFIAMSGSAGLGFAESCGIPFVQEVYATRVCAEKFEPGTDVAIELGGEDAKILFLKGVPDARMNGSCAGGTGAFIDQMAALLHVSLDELNELAKGHEKIYTIASRCGVFAKSDIQPLLNQGANKSDIAASIFSAVVNQTIGGLAQGRPIKGKVLYLGGPLSFLSELRKSFDEGLKLTGTCPENSLYYVSTGAALSASEQINLDELIGRMQSAGTGGEFAFMPPLFASQEEYKEFTKRHERAQVPKGDLQSYEGGVFLGIDAGSTTVKFAVIGLGGELLESRYQSNNGNPVPLVKNFLEELYKKRPDIRILRSAVTGYGEDLIRNAFSIDHGIVETIAHFTAAKTLEPNVEFILDIGGQDIKCMRIHNGTVDNIYLNEACSSGCGSFLQTFAEALNQDIADFAKLGLFADKPVDLGSRCTVFMNSSVKQAQKDGASKENISAGLSISVVKNALYKVIRPSSKSALGTHIVVQGGTFLNDAVLRAFEKELNIEATRPDIAGLMGAYGAAIYAKERYGDDEVPSSLISEGELKAFTHEVSAAKCGLCQNNCYLNINRFPGGRKYISGNRCERPITQKAQNSDFNMYEQKLMLLKQYKPLPGKRGKIGIPFGLNMFELLPLWHTFFTLLGFEVVLSPISDRALYLLGQGTIPSDTVCFPAKLMHGHVQTLIDQGVPSIFYPCGSYNFDDGLGDNCYNCPIVAFYPEVIASNMPDIQGVKFINGYVGLHKKKHLPKKLHAILEPHFPDIGVAEVKAALKAGFEEYDAYMQRVREIGETIIQKARQDRRPIIVLAGRPYHIDPEINHGMDRLIAGFNVAIISEDAIALDAKGKVPPLKVLNQWTYHSRLYAAAQQVSENADMQFVQLVSFGCGCDAITSDECRRLLEASGKIYTQIKIDEIENLGAAKIRLRSLFAATRIDN